MKNLPTKKVIVLAACAASTASSSALPTTGSRGAPWVARNVPRGGSRSDNNGDGSGKTPKSSSNENRSTGKKKKTTKKEETKSKVKSDAAQGGNSDSSSNKLLEEIIRQDDFYDVLGVSKSASDREIKKAYRKRCVQTHPDKTSGDRRAFDKVAEAYDVLSDSSKRQTYNQFGKAGLDPTNPNNGAAFGGGGAAADMFRSMFQQAQNQRQQRARRNQTLRYQLEVTLEDLYYGRTQSVMVSPPRNRYQSYSQQRHQRKEVEVHIEKGSLSGQSIIMSGEVDFNDDDSPPGDLVFVLTQAPHSTFTRKGHDLAMELTISLEEALCGLQRSIKHLDGTELWIESATRHLDQPNSQESKLKREEISNDKSDEEDDTIDSIPVMIQTGDVQVLKGRGMPKRNQNGEFGDLYIQYRVEMPQNSKRKGSARGVLTKKEYKELARLLSKLEVSNGKRSRSDLARQKFRNRRDETGEEETKEVPRNKFHSLREAKSSDFGVASGRVTWEEEEGPSGSMHEEEQFNPFGTSFFGGSGFGGRTYSQQFHFGGPGGPFEGGAFGSSTAGGDDDGNVQCQQM